MDETQHFFLTLVRHGETDGNKFHIIEGSIDRCLNDMGVHQAEQLSEKLDYTQFNKIFASDLSRAFKTAEIVSQSGKRIQMDVRLRELDLGQYEGKHLSAFQGHDEHMGHLLRYSTPEGCETLGHLRQRVVDFFNYYLVCLISNGFKVLVVSHGAVIREIIKYMRDDLNCQYDCDDPENICTNTAVTEFKIYYNKNGFISAECLKFHDTKHLHDSVKAMEM